MMMKMREDEGGDDAAEESFGRLPMMKGVKTPGRGDKKTVQVSARGSSLVNEEVWILAREELRLWRAHRREACESEYYPVHVLVPGSMYKHKRTGSNPIFHSRWTLALWILLGRGCSMGWRPNDDRSGGTVAPIGAGGVARVEASLDAPQPVLFRRQRRG
jgi:hypothetical protein